MSPISGHLSFLFFSIRIPISGHLLRWPNCRRRVVVLPCFLESISPNCIGIGKPNRKIRAGFLPSIFGAVSLGWGSFRRGETAAVLAQLPRQALLLPLGFRSSKFGEETTVLLTVVVHCWPRIRCCSRCSLRISAAVDPLNRRGFELRRRFVGTRLATMKLLVAVENKTLCAKFGGIPPFKGS